MILSVVVFDTMHWKQETNATKIKTSFHLTYRETFNKCRLQKILKKICIIILFTKHQKAKPLSAEMNYNDHKKLLKLSILGDFTLYLAEKQNVVLFAHDNLSANEPNRQIALNRQKCLILIIFGAAVFHLSR